MIVSRNVGREGLAFTYPTDKTAGGSLSLRVVLLEDGIPVDEEYLTATPNNLELRVPELQALAM